MARKIFMPVLAVLLLVSMLFYGVGSANDEIKRRERELEEVKAKMEALNESIDANKTLQSQTNQKIKNTNANVKALEREINGLNGEITQTEEAIVEQTEALELAELAIADKNDLLNSRLRVMYKTGEIGYLEVLFGAEDFNDLLSRIDMLQKVLIHDQNLIVSLKEQRDAIEEKKTQLEATKDQLLSLFKSKVAAQNELNVALTKLVSYKEQLVEDEAAMVEMENTLHKEANDLTDIIKNLELAATYIGGEMMWPVPGHFSVNSPFGMRMHPISKAYSMHTGIDIPAASGTPIVAANTGTVVFADWFGGYGKTVIVDHGGGIVTLYAHCRDILVSVGKSVGKGETIANVGTTGYSTGPHLHFEVRVNGEYVDPITYVTGN